MVIFLVFIHQNKVYFFFFNIKALRVRLGDACTKYESGSGTINKIIQWDIF